MSKFSAEFIAAAARKPQCVLFVGFLKIKNSLASFSLSFENSSPKGFSWQNMKKSVISVLKINSRYLQSPGLIYLSGERYCERKVSRPRTRHNFPLDPEASALTMRPPRLYKGVKMKEINHQ